METIQEEINDSGKVNIKDNVGTLHLVLEINDKTIVTFLSQYESPQREDKAIETLKVGVIAIQSASPFLDTRVVEEKFTEVKEAIDKCIEDFSKDLKSNLDDNFKSKSGTVPLSIEGAFGEEGTVSKVFETYFGKEHGKVLSLLKEQVGPESSFAKSIDPSNKESVVSRIQENIQKQLDDKLKDVLKEFSLDQCSGSKESGQMMG